MDFQKELNNIQVKHEKVFPPPTFLKRAWKSLKVSGKMENIINKKTKEELNGT